MIESERVITAVKRSAQEEALERALRPRTLADYVGQEKVREQLGIFIEAARRRQRTSCSDSPTSRARRLFLRTCRSSSEA